MLAPMLTTTMPTPTHTNRCRQRRTTTSTTRLTSHRTWIARAVPSTPATVATSVSAGERTELIAWSTRVSATSKTVTLPVTTTTIHATTTAALRASHHLPDAFR